VVDRCDQMELQTESDWRAGPPERVLMRDWQSVMCLVELVTNSLSGGTVLRKPCVGEVFLLTGNVGLCM